MRTCLFVKHRSLWIGGSGTKIALKGEEVTMATLIKGFDAHKIMNKHGVVQAWAAHQVTPTTPP